MKIGIIREGKVPPDNRVALTPAQCVELKENFGFRVIVQPSPIRCFKDTEYAAVGIELTEDLSDCDILIGVKEVPISLLQPFKTYFFFSHTIKKQQHNRKMLQAILDKHIRLIDYEVLTDDRGERLIAFGKFAGMVGAHNALWTYGERTGKFHLPRMKDLHDYNEAKAVYAKTVFPPVKIVLTGTGRVGSGALEVLLDMGIRQVSPEDFLGKRYDEAVFAQLDSAHYVRRKDGSAYQKAEFYKHPELYESAFEPYLKVCDILINGIYWDKRSPAFFTVEQMAQPDFNIEVIADVTCDIMPDSSIPSTIKASTIQEPVFGFDPLSGKEVAPFQPTAVDIMSIDNLPNEMPRDASDAFGRMFLDHVSGELRNKNSEVLRRATITDDGHLTEKFSYLEDFVKEGATVAKI